MFVLCFFGSKLDVTFVRFPSMSGFETNWGRKRIKKTDKTQK